MSANKNNISQIRKYLNGELDARAMHELERQALDDQFLADALEGYEQQSNQEQHLSDLQKRLQSRIAPTKKRLSLWSTLSIAASVLLFIAVGGWWLVSGHQAGVQSEVAVPDKTIVKTQPVMPAVKAPSPKPDSAVLKPASPENLMIADNRESNLAQKSITGNYAPVPNAVPAAPQAKSAPVQVQPLHVDEVVTSPEMAQQLAAKIAANTKGLAGGSPEIRIRGLSSATSKEPLYVVDGQIYDGQLTNSIIKDTEKVSVLKDTSATAIYGAKAAGGVIAITTKPGSASRLKSDSLRLSKNMLAEVVVVGYGTQHKTSVVGAISSVKAEEMNQVLQGRVAGVTVSKSTKKVKAADTPRTITGKVVDKSGSPLAGVYVAVTDKDQKVLTDINGKFKINAAVNDELKLAYVGYEAKQLRVKGIDSLNVTLNESGSALSEVVVVGYSASQDREEKAARPQNGWNELNKCLKQNAKPVNGKTGVVRLSFVVNTDGSLTNFKVLKSLSPEADHAAIKLIEEGPTWLPNTNREPETVRLRIRFK